MSSREISLCIHPNSTVIVVKLIKIVFMFPFSNVWSSIMLIIMNLHLHTSTTAAPVYWVFLNDTIGSNPQNWHLGNKLNREVGGNPNSIDFATTTAEEWEGKRKVAITFPATLVQTCPWQPTVWNVLSSEVSSNLTMLIPMKKWKAHIGTRFFFGQL